MKKSRFHLEVIYPRIIYYASVYVLIFVSIFFTSKELEAQSPPPAYWSCGAEPCTSNYLNFKNLSDPEIGTVRVYYIRCQDVLQITGIKEFGKLRYDYSNRIAIQRAYLLKVLKILVEQTLSPDIDLFDFYQTSTTTVIKIQLPTCWQTALCLAGYCPETTGENPNHVYLPCGYYPCCFFHFRKLQCSTELELLWKSIYTECEGGASGEFDKFSNLTYTPPVPGGFPTVTDICGCTRFTQSVECNVNLFNCRELSDLIENR